MKYLFTITFTLIISIGKCCDCHSKLFKPFTKDNYNDYEIIFLGEIGKEIQKNQFELKIIEVFKGETTFLNTIINPDENYCFKKVQSGEKWLIYTNSNKPELYVEECSRSREIEKMKYWIPSPPLSNNKNQKKKQKIVNNEYLKSDRGYINDELKALKELKANNR